MGFAGYTRTTAALLCLLVTHSDSSSLSSDTSMNAIELLTAFSGKDAKQYEPYFRFSEDSRIIAVEIHAVGTESTTARYSGGSETWKEVNNILRITTADGFAGISGVGSSNLRAFSAAHPLECPGLPAEPLAATESFRGRALPCSPARIPGRLVNLFRALAVGMASLWWIVRRTRFGKLTPESFFFAADFIGDDRDVRLYRELEDGERQKILDIALSHPGVTGLHDLRTRSSGNQVFIQMHLEMDGEISLLEAHTISDAVEASVLEAFPNAEVLIHEDPEGVEEKKAVFH